MTILDRMALRNLGTSAQSMTERASTLASLRQCRELADCIARRIGERLGSRLQNLKVEATADRVVLTGRCATYHTKQLAQHCAQGVLDEQVLVNDIDVLIG